jgi:hypothetical protein
MLMDLVAHDVGGGLGACGKIEFFEERADVVAHGLLAEEDKEKLC